MKDPSAIYDAAWFVKDFDHPGVKEDFFRIADCIYRQFRPRWSHDYGCGPGMLIERLDQHGCYVTGYEGSVHGVNHASSSVREKIRLADLTTLTIAQRPLSTGIPTPPGVVICTEVAEHIEKEHSAHLVDLLCAHMAPVIFTAAPPGQGGHDHCNEQPPEFWIQLFAERGAYLDRPATLELKQRWQGCIKVLHHMHRNVMVFR